MRKLLIFCVIAAIAFVALAANRQWFITTPSGAVTLGTGYSTVAFVNTGDVDFTGIGGSVLGVTASGNPTLTISAAVAGFTLTTAMDLVEITCAADCTVALYDVTGNGGESHHLLNLSSTTIVTLDPSGAQLIEGAATLLLLPGQTYSIETDGTDLNVY